MKTTSVHRKFLVATVLISGSLLAACSAQNLSTNGTVNQVNLERDYQEVVHTDCNGNVTLDDIETVSSPTAWVQIEPSNAADDGDDAIFTDQQTSSSPALVLGGDQFQVDYSYGALNMHVISGINNINYQFYRCATSTTDANGNVTCLTTQTDETGTAVINVNYAEKTLPGTMQVSDCNPSPSPSPSPAAQVLSQHLKH